MCKHWAQVTRRYGVKKIQHTVVTLILSLSVSSCGTVTEWDIKSRHSLRYAEIHSSCFQCCMAAMDRANIKLTYLKIQKWPDSGCVNWNRLNKALSFAYSAIQDGRYKDCVEHAHDVEAYVDWELDYIQELRAIHYDL